MPEDMNYAESGLHVQQDKEHVQTDVGLCHQIHLVRNATAVGVEDNRTERHLYTINQWCNRDFVFVNNADFMRDPKNLFYVFGSNGGLALRLRIRRVSFGQTCCS